MPKKPSKRTAKPKSRRKPKGKKKPLIQSNLTKAVIGLVILLVLVIAGGLVFDHFLKPLPRKVKPSPKTVQAPPPPTTAKKAAVKHRVKKTGPQKQATAKALQPPAPVKTPVYEIYPQEEIPPSPIRHPKPPPKGLPQVAIIIDDVGYDRAMAEKFIHLESELTLSLFPYAPYRRSIAKMARQKGLDLMLHLPMEPNEYPRIDPGPGKLLTSMTPDQLIAQLIKDLDQVPGIKGVNNHMGSKMTARADQMNQIFTILKKRGYFFIDSRTTKETVCRSSARLLKVPFAQRKVFLDHSQDPETVRRQIRRLIHYAQKYGQAIGIGHPYTVTYRVLKEELPALKKKVGLIKASKIVRIVS